MGTITTLASGQIGTTDTITIELVRPSDMPLGDHSLARPSLGEPSSQVRGDGGGRVQDRARASTELARTPGHSHAETPT
jgi:hypothetical protein